MSYLAVNKNYVHAKCNNQEHKMKKSLVFELSRDQFAYVFASYLQAAKFISETGYYRGQNTMSCEWFLQFPYKIFAARATAKQIRSIHRHSIRSINSKVTKSRSFGIRVSIKNDVSRDWESRLKTEKTLTI